MHIHAHPHREEGQTDRQTDTEGAERILCKADLAGCTLEAQFLAKRLQ